MGGRPPRARAALCMGRRCAAGPERRCGVGVDVKAVVVEDAWTERRGVARAPPGGDVAWKCGRACVGGACAGVDGGCVRAGVCELDGGEWDPGGGIEGTVVRGSKTNKVSACPPHSPAIC